MAITLANLNRFP